MAILTPPKLGTVRYLVLEWQREMLEFILHLPGDRRSGVQTYALGSTESARLYLKRELPSKDGEEPWENLMDMAYNFGRALFIFHSQRIVQADSLGNVPESVWQEQILGPLMAREGK